MLRSSTVTSPDGHHWRVGRRWLGRPLPDLRRRFRANREKVGEEGTWFDGLMIPDFDVLDFDDSPAAAIAIAIGALLLFLILLPLIGIALELIVLLVLLWSGIVGRVLFGRPWIVVAANLDDPQRSAAFAVKGWQRSGQATDTLRTAIIATGTPSLNESD
jgi:hypothetical protein